MRYSRHLRPAAIDFARKTAAWLAGNQDRLVIDADTHITDLDSLTGPRRTRYLSSTAYYHGRPISAEDLVGEMDRAAVDMALAWQNPAATGYTGDADENAELLLAANRYVFDSAVRNPERILPAGWTDPKACGVANALRIVDTCIGDFGFAVVKMNPAQNGYAIDGGLRMPDPANPNLELRRWGPTSSFIVPGTEKAIFEDRRVPHGAVHVEFYDSTFTNPLGLTLLQVGIGETTYPYFSNVVFDQSSSYGEFGGAELHFWSDTATQDFAESNPISFRWDWGNPGDPYQIGDTIGIRVIATVPVPEPAAGSLVIAGLAALAAHRRRAGARSSPADPGPGFADA